MLDEQVAAEHRDPDATGHGAGDAIASGDGEHWQVGDVAGAAEVLALPSARLGGWCERRPIQCRSTGGGPGWLWTLALRLWRRQASGLCAGSSGVVRRRTLRRPLPHLGQW